MPTIYAVQVQHRTSAKPWQGAHTFTVKPDGDRGFYATAPHFGCSKTYPTETDSIHCMLQDHACYAVKIEKAG